MKPIQGTIETAVRRVNGKIVDELAPDLLAVEEPLEIRLGFQQDGRRIHKAISITMRTPGADAELAVGFLFTEGIIKSPEQIKQIRHCGPRSQPAAPPGRGGVAESSRLAWWEATGGPRVANREPIVNDSGSTNTIRIDLAEETAVDLKRLQRNFYTTSSCGVCGKSSIEALHTGAKKLESNGIFVDEAVIRSLPEKLRRAQSVFEKTGGLHASGLFNSKGHLELLREDVGRHNALDKVIGAKFLAGELPLSDRVLLVSGRASFELVQKALMAGIPILAAVGAPSSLAVELAAEFNMTLVGFVKDDGFNIYCGADRIRRKHER